MNPTSKNVTRTDKLGLIAEWMDPYASLLRKFYLFFYPFDSTIEIYEIKKNRLFLKRTRVKNLNFGDIYLGNVITVFSRQFKVVDYANLLTKRLLAVKLMKTFGLIKPDGMKKKAEIFKMLLENGFKIGGLRMLKFSDPLVKTFLKREVTSESFQGLVTHLQTGPCIVLELVGDNAVEAVQKIAGHKEPSVARKQDPGTISAKFGMDEVHNAFYCSTDVSRAAEETQLFFEDQKVLKDRTLQTVISENSTCCIIKPHAIKEGKMADIIAEIEKNGYNISAMQMFYMDSANAEEFFEIYKGVLIEFHDMVQELVSGACVAMEIIGPYGEDNTQYFRTFVGPSDPETAKKLRPNSLRAMFGRDRIHNAIHATDMPTDGILEVEYFFKILV